MLQGCAGSWRDESMAVHRPHEAHLPHRLPRGRLRCGR